MIQDRIEQLISKYTGHDMIGQYAKQPAFPRTRIRLLAMCLQHSGLPQKQNDLYASAAALVQMGLDTHDGIDTNAGYTTEREMRSRQLNVLGGDYFSSRFYQLLAQAGEIGMVRMLSDAVCEVNRLKMNFYDRDKQHSVTAEQYIGFLTAIKTELFRGFAAKLDSPIASLWDDLLISFARCEVLLGELLHNGAAAMRNNWAYFHIAEAGSDPDVRLMADQARLNDAAAAALFDKYEIKRKLSDLLGDQVEEAKGFISHLGNNRLAGELHELADSFLQAMAAPALHSEMR